MSSCVSLEMQVEFAGQLATVRDSVTLFVRDWLFRSGQPA
jgi:hypothetical protein